MIKELTSGQDSSKKTYKEQRLYIEISKKLSMQCGETVLPQSFIMQTSQLCLTVLYMHSGPIIQAILSKDYVEEICNMQETCAFNLLEPIYLK